MRVSVITINYNNAEGLEQTIQSVVNQQFSDFEYIVIDGGSNDGSKQILQKYSDKITYWISEPDKGIYEAMKKGIVKSKGEYLHFLNSGDIYADNDVLFNVFQNKEYSDPLLRGIQICNDKNGVFRWYNHGDRDITLYDLYTDTMQHQATFIKRTLFDKYGLYDERYKIVSDWKFFLQAILGDETSFYLGIDIVIFDMTGMSNNPELHDLMYKERYAVFDEVIPKTIRPDYDRIIALEKENQHLRRYKKYIKLGKFIHRLKGRPD